MDLTREFTRLWTALGAQGDPLPVYAALERAYSEPHRHYHTLQHLEQGLHEYDVLRKNGSFDAGAILESEFSFFFHDARYDVLRNGALVHDNEEQSALWAKRVSLDAGLPAVFADDVFANIVATKHDGVPERLAAKILVDVDLSILGQSRDVFTLYEENIRKEYAFVPEAQYCAARATILEGFLAREQLYLTRHFHETYEDNAKENLARSIARLRQPSVSSR